MTEFSDAERDTLRGAAVGAMMLISRADPGFFAMFKESLAGANALAGAPPRIAELFEGAGMPAVPRESSNDLAPAVLGQLRQAVGLLRNKAPDQLDAYRSVILAACDEVAGASGGVRQSETAMIAKVKQALGVG